ncbi:MAG TPA: alpha/beta hydrolase [Terriglobales bacterium]|nr:alpha/beta hydrolase [Terriglobales bacterium]
MKRCWELKAAKKQVGNDEQTAAVEKSIGRPEMNPGTRRDFLRGLGLIAAGIGLTQCSLIFKQQVPPPPLSDAEIQALLAQALQTFRESWDEAGGLTIHSRISVDVAPANAPAIVLVHGSGLSGTYMLPTAEALKANCRVYVPDLPGFGDSEKPQKVLNVSELADSLAVWLPALGLERASFLGNSFGCQVIADLAARYPERVERAILQGPTTPPHERSVFWQFVRWRQNQAYNPKSLGDVTLQAYRKCGLRRMIVSFRYQLTDRIEDKAPHISAPVLVVRGQYDPIANERWCERIVRLCPHGTLAWLPGVAHTLCYTDPVQLAGVTLAFLQHTEPLRLGASFDRQLFP